MNPMIRNDLRSALLHDSNFSLLEYPKTSGRLRFAVFETWIRDGAYHVNFGTVDNVVNVDTGENFEVGAIKGLNAVDISGDLVCLGHDEDTDIAIWRLLPSSRIFLERYRTKEYVLEATGGDDFESEGVRAEAITRASGVLIASHIIDFSDRTA